MEKKTEHVEEPSKVFLPTLSWMDQSGFLSSAEPEDIIKALEYMLEGDSRISFLSSDQTHSIAGSVSLYKKVRDPKVKDDVKDEENDAKFSFCITIYDRSIGKSTREQRMKDPSSFANNSYVEFHRTQGSTIDFQRFFQDCMLCISKDILPCPPKFCKFSEIVNLNHHKDSAIEGPNAKNIPRILSTEKLQDNFELYLSSLEQEPSC